MIAIHAHDIPHIFPAEVIAEAEAGEAGDACIDREDWRDLPLVTIDPADAKDHDDAVYRRARPRRRTTRAASSSPSPSPMSPPMCRPARRSTARR